MDWRGKTLVPFQTHAGWPGHCLEDMEQVCRGARVRYPKKIHFSPQQFGKLETPRQELESWLAELKTLTEEANRYAVLFYRYGQQPVRGQGDRTGASQHPPGHARDPLDFTADAIGIVCPVYGHEVPPMVREFLQKAKFHTGYFYMVLTYGNRHGGAAELAQRL